MRKKVKSQNREAYVKYGSTSNRNVRNSNFELLRIVAIVFITMHHLLINGLDICGYNKPFEISSSSAVAVMLNSMFVGGGKFVPSYFRLVWHQESDRWHRKINV